MRALIRGVFAALALAGVASPPATGAPNILVVLTDDQRSDTLSVMPATRANFDVVFGTGLVTTPDCCPSRASILTGEYAHTHGVKTNWDHALFAAREAESLGPWLQAQGYYTGLIGKYLNKYRLDEPVPVGWDEFHARVWGADGAMIGNGHTSLALRQYAPDQNEIVSYDGVYATEMFASLAARFIRRAHDSAYNPEARPWALFVWPTAPHSPFIPEPRYAHAPVPTWQKPPSFLEADMADKPREVRKSRLRRDALFPHETIRADTLRMLMSVDDLVDEVWKTVDDHDERESTWGIFTSDNGYSWGEHWLTAKLHAYEESARVPFQMAVPDAGALAFPGATAANIDVAATILDIAGAPTRATDGKSLVPTIRGAGACLCRRAIVIENWEGPLYRAVRTPFWTYVSWPSGRRELYRLRRDPYQLRNVEATNPGVVARLHQRMEEIIGAP